MFIVLEGLDGAGKSTQVAMLRRMFEERGVRSEYVHFPRFDAPVYGELIARFLRGEFGGVEEVDPYLVALLFAGDRAEAAPQIRQWLAEGRAVILDRYVYSNVAYQCAKLPEGEPRRRLARWILDLEFGHNDLPRPDLSLFLDVPLPLPKAALRRRAKATTAPICTVPMTSTNRRWHCSAPCARSTLRRRPTTPRFASSTAATTRAAWLRPRSSPNGSAPASSRCSESTRPKTPYLPA